MSLEEGTLPKLSAQEVQQSQSLRSLQLPHYLPHSSHHSVNLSHTIRSRYPQCPFPLQSQGIHPIRFVLLVFHLLFTVYPFILLLLATPVLISSES